MTYKEFGARLKEIRKEKKISRQEVAAAMGIKPNSYTSIESGLKGTNILKLPILAGLLGVSTDYLLGVSDI